MAATGPLWVGLNFRGVNVQRTHHRWHRQPAISKCEICQAAPLVLLWPSAGQASVDAVVDAVACPMASQPPRGLGLARVVLRF